MIKIEGLTKKLGNLQLENINLEIFDNEYFVILGPTATGKTVLLEMIAGLIPPERGEVYFNKERVTDVPPEARQVGMVYQDYCLFPHLNVRQNICFGLTNRGEKREKIEAAFDEIVQRFEISYLAERKVHNLSGGEQQRVAIARALITEPQILLLDEPLSALDPETKVAFQARLKQIHATANTTTIHVTHDFNEAIALADRIAIMQEGKIVQVGTPEEIFQHPATSFVAKFVGARNIFQGEAFVQGDIATVRVQECLTIKAQLQENAKQLLTRAMVEVTRSKEITDTTDYKDGKDHKDKGPFPMPVSLVIRPEDIFLSKEAMAEGNSFLGKVTGIWDRFSLTEVTVDIGIALTVYLTRQYLAELRINVGAEIYVGCKPSAVHLLLE